MNFGIQIGNDIITKYLSASFLLLKVNESFGEAHFIRHASFEYKNLQIIDVRVYYVHAYSHHIAVMPQIRSDDDVIYKSFDVTFIWTICNLYEALDNFSNQKLHPFISPYFPSKGYTPFQFQLTLIPNDEGVFLEILSAVRICLIVDGDNPPTLQLVSNQTWSFSNEYYKYFFANNKTINSVHPFTFTFDVADHQCHKLTSVLRKKMFTNA